MTEEEKIAIRKERRIFYYVMAGITFAVLLVFIFFKQTEFGLIIKVIDNAFRPFIMGLCFAFILNVFVNMFEKKVFKQVNIKLKDSKVWNSLQRPITLILSYLMVAGLIYFIILVIVPELQRSIETFIETSSTTVPVYANNFVTWINQVVIDYELDIDVLAIRDTVANNFSWSTIIDNATKIGTDILSGVFTATINIASFVISLFMVIIYSAYFLLGKERICGACKKMIYAFLPRKVSNNVSMFLSISNKVFSNYVRGQLTECVILGSLCFIGMAIIGIDYALLISSIITLGALIPILGAYVAAAVGAVILLMVSPGDVIWFLIFYLCLQQFEGNVIYPRVVGSSIGLPGVWTLTAVMVFGSMFGIPGILIGTPFAAVVYRLLKFYTETTLKNKGITQEVIDGSEVMETYRDLFVPKEEHVDKPTLMEKISKKIKIKK